MTMLSTLIIVELSGNLSFREQLLKVLKHLEGDNERLKVCFFPCDYIRECTLFSFVNRKFWPRRSTRSSYAMDEDHFIQSQVSCRSGCRFRKS